MDPVTPYVTAHGVFIIFADRLLSFQPHLNSQVVSCTFQAQLAAWTCRLVMRGSDLNK